MTSNRIGSSRKEVAMIRDCGRGLGDTGVGSEPPQRTAIGLPGEPVAPRSRKGAKMKANS